MNNIEKLAKSMGINLNELYSGKYGNSYDEIMSELLKRFAQ